jgi:hypothetical protein
MQTAPSLIHVRAFYRATVREGTYRSIEPWSRAAVEWRVMYRIGGRSILIWDIMAWSVMLVLIKMQTHNFNYEPRGALKHRFHAEIRCCPTVAHLSLCRDDGYFIRTLTGRPWDNLVYPRICFVQSSWVIRYSHVVERSTKNSSGFVASFARAS